MKDKLIGKVFIDNKYGNKHKLMDIYLGVDNQEYGAFHCYLINKTIAISLDWMIKNCFIKGV